MVKHFCRSTKSWFFSSLKMVSFCHIANFLILLKISGLQDQAKNLLTFFFRQPKNPLVVFLQICLTTQMKDIDLYFLKIMIIFWRFSSKVYLLGCKVRPTGEMSDYTFPSIYSRSLWGSPYALWKILGDWAPA